MKDWLEAGRFRPGIDRRYTLDGLREAFAYVASGQKTGNVLLEPNAESGTDRSKHAAGWRTPGESQPAS